MTVCSALHSSTQYCTRTLFEPCEPVSQCYMMYINVYILLGRAQTPESALSGTLWPYMFIFVRPQSCLWTLVFYLYWSSLAPSQHGGQCHGSLDQSEQLSDSYSIPPSAPKERIQHQSVFFSWWLLLSVLPDRTHPAPSLLSELSRLMVLTHVTFHYIRTTATFYNSVHFLLM